MSNELIGPFSKVTPDLLAAVQHAALEFLGGLDGRPAGCIPRKPSQFAALPDRGEGTAAALKTFRERFEAGLSGSAGPRYLGFVTGGSTPAALAGDWLASAYDQNVSNDGDSIATFVELETLAMLRDLFGLPEAFHGAFVTGATQANLVALAAARQWAANRLDIDVAEQGLWAIPRIPILSGAPHASIYKALSILGMGRVCIERLSLIPGRQTVDPVAVEDRLRSLAGHPAIVVAGAGEVNTGQFDNIEALSALCRRYGAWLHVDGAFGLFAACDPDRAAVLQGIETADSVASDGHKWLNVPYDSGFVFTRHLALQEAVFRASAAYLGESSTDMLHRTPENSRRFRALPAWMTLRAYGREGYRQLVRRNCEQAKRLADWIVESKHFELLANVELNICCFALAEESGSDGVDERDRFLDRLTRDGRAYLTPTFFGGRPGMRAAFSNWATGDDDLDQVFAALEASLR